MPSDYRREPNNLTRSSTWDLSWLRSESATYKRNTPGGISAQFLHTSVVKSYSQKSIELGLLRTVIWPVA